MGRFIFCKKGKPSHTNPSHATNAVNYWLVGYIEHVHPINVNEEYPYSFHISQGAWVDKREHLHYTYFRRVRPERVICDYLQRYIIFKKRNARIATREPLLQVSENVFSFLVSPSSSSSSATHDDHMSSIYDVLCNNDWIKEICLYL